MTELGRLVLDELPWLVQSITLEGGVIVVTAHGDIEGGRFRTRPDWALFAPDGTLVCSGSGDPDSPTRKLKTGPAEFRLPLNIEDHRMRAWGP